MMAVWLMAGAASALALAAGLCRLVMELGPRDAPTEARKIQKAPVPTSGGLGFALACFAAWAGACLAGGAAPGAPVYAVSGASLGALALGLADDVWRLPARPKLLIMLALCLGLAAAGVRVEAMTPWPGAVWLLPLAAGAAGSILWLVVVVNAVNFMDGANGLAMGMAGVAAAALAACFAIAGAWDAALLGAALAGALCGFLVWNVHGRLFAGDAGALFVGMMLGGLSLYLVMLRPEWICVPPVLLMPFLTDVLLTLAWRGRVGKRLFAAHRDHAYQIAMKAGLKHWQVAAIHAVWALNAAAMGVVAAIAGGYVPLLVLLALAAASTWVHVRVRVSGVKAGLVGAQIP
jgi:UDP-GlcNAc:undecaprenyl-phosphate GlcNAc-1-phosphate transferase